MLKKLGWFIFFMVMAMGVDYELGALIGSELTAAQFMQIMTASLFLLIYLIPITFLLYYIRKKWHFNRWKMIATLFACIFLSGWIAAEANGFLGGFLIGFFGESQTLTDWNDALTAPLIEELLKIAAAYLMIYLFQIKGRKHIFITGILSGLAFQIIEDFDYIAYQAMDEPRYIFQTAVERASTCLASHWLYTGILTIAVYQFYLIATSKSKFKLCHLIWLLTPMLSHLLRNSPLPLGPYNIIPAFVTAFTLMVGLDIYHDLEKETLIPKPQ